MQATFSGVLWVALGGAVGSVGRYLVAGFAARLPAYAGFPLGTLLVNVSGSLAIGLAAGFAENRQLVFSVPWLLVVVGILGGYTTFSAYSLETLTLLRAGQSGTAVINIAAQTALGLLAAWSGYSAGRLI